MATRVAYYICKSDAFKVFESDKTTLIATYKTHDLASDDVEIDEEVRGVYDDVAETFTFDDGGELNLATN